MDEGLTAERLAAIEGQYAADLAFYQIMAPRMVEYLESLPIPALLAEVRRVQARVTVLETALRACAVPHEDDCASWWGRACNCAAAVTNAALDRALAGESDPPPPPYRLEPDGGPGAAS